MVQCSAIEVQMMMCLEYQTFPKSIAKYNRARMEVVVSKHSRKRGRIQPTVRCRQGCITPRHVCLAAADGPVEVDVLARRDFADSWVTADRSPDLCLELTCRNIIAIEQIV
jgi:hypothetical protein